MSQKIKPLEPRDITSQDDFQGYPWTQEDILPKKLYIAEVGFGCGLNFLSLWQHLPQDCQLFFYATEARPFDKVSLSKTLSNWPELEFLSQQLLSAYPPLTRGYHYLNFRNVSLVLMFGDACFNLAQLMPKCFFDKWLINDIIDLETCKKIALHSKLTVTSVVAPKVLQQKLENCGFRTNCASSELYKGIYNYRVIIPSHTAWFYNKLVKTKSAIVVGAGLAGCALAHELALEKYQVTICDDNNNRLPFGLLSGAWSSYESQLTNFYSQSYPFAVNFYKKFCTLSGALLLKDLKFDPLVNKHLKEVSRSKAQDIANIKLERGGFYLPDSGIVDVARVCKQLLAHKLITFKNIKLHDFKFHHNLWHADNEVAEVLIFANAPTTLSYLPHLPLTFVAGMLSKIKTSSATKDLALAISGSGYIFPESFGYHWLGATFHPDKTTIDNFQQDHVDINTKLAKIISNFNSKAEHFFCGVRNKTPDYLPLVGACAKPESFYNTYLKKGRKQLVDKFCDYHQNLYVFTGFGSKAISAIPLSAAYLAKLISRDISIIPKDLVQAISPNRFLLKKLS